MMPKTKSCRKPIKATLIWFNPAATSWYGQGKNRGWNISGKGYGIMRDEEGNEYFVYGQELGGGLYGEDADKMFLKPGRTYLIHSYWINDRLSKADGSPHSEPFFMGTPRRVRTVSLPGGRKPSTKLREKEEAKIKALAKKRAA